MCDFWKLKNIKYYTNFENYNKTQNRNKTFAWYSTCNKWRKWQKK